MPVTRAPQFQVIYAECNSPNGSGGDDPVIFDTFYDKAQDDITAGITAALAAMGLTLTADKFTATRPGIFALDISFDAVTAPGPQSNRAGFITPSYQSDSRTEWGADYATSPNPPPMADCTISKTVYLATGEQFYMTTQALDTVSAGVIGYAAMSIVRLV